MLYSTKFDSFSEGTGLPEKDKRFIADFYKYGFVGVMLDWIKDGMQEDYSTIVKKMSLTLHGNISNSIGNFLDEGWFMFRMTVSNVVRLI